jgi:hypothetical protein
MRCLFSSGGPFIKRALDGGVQRFVHLAIRFITDQKEI